MLEFFFPFFLGGGLLHNAIITVSVAFCLRKVSVGTCFDMFRFEMKEFLFDTPLSFYLSIFHKTLSHASKIFTQTDFKIISIHSLRGGERLHMILT